MKGAGGWGYESNQPSMGSEPHSSGELGYLGYYGHDCYESGVHRHASNSSALGAGAYSYKMGRQIAAQIPPKTAGTKKSRITTEKLIKTAAKNLRGVLRKCSQTAAGKFHEVTSKYNEAAADLRREMECENVQFAVFAPSGIMRDSTFMLDVWAYLEHQYSSVINMAKKLKRDEIAGIKSGVSVPIGEVLTVTVQLEAVDINEPVQTIVWDGVPTNASFIVHVSVDVSRTVLSGMALIGYRGITIAKVPFQIKLSDSDYTDYINHSTKTFYPKTAFASYASENCEEVFSRVQGMKKVAPDLEIFIDVFSLRSGENWQEKLEQHVPDKDMFYLFWSQEAARSKWVEREWRLALEKRGIDYISPVPLEEPDLAPPPRELNILHFNDAYMGYIAYRRAKRRMQV